MTPDPYAEKIVLVTGASSGMGKATAIYLAGKGVKAITLFARGKDRLDEVANEIEAMDTPTKTLIVVGDASKVSDNQRAVDETVAAFGGINSPSRIECYDISHTQGEFPVGSRVVFIDGKPAPHLYRKFNIRSEKGQDARDDYSSLEEVLERRFRRAWIKDQGTLVDKESPWAIPDLVLVDGGVGQLGAAIRGMSQADMVPFVAKSTEVTCNSSRLTAAVPICSLAKNEELVFVDGRSEPVNQSPDSPALLLLRSLRDESHRFALSSHRKRRSVTKST